MNWIVTVLVDTPGTSTWQSHVFSLIVVFSTWLLVLLCDYYQNPVARRTYFEQHAESVVSLQVLTILTWWSRLYIPLICFLYIWCLESLTNLGDCIVLYETPHPAYTADDLV